MAISQRYMLFALIAAGLMLSACADGGLVDGLPDDYSLDGGYHTQGFAAGQAHGTAFYQSPAECQRCHGDDLAGGELATSCDSCHNGWQRDCGFCHLGAGSLKYGSSEASQRSHLAHSVDTDLHSAYACEVCHVAPESVLSPGHIDGEAGVEIALAAIAGHNASYTASGCQSIYCHGADFVEAPALEWTSDADFSCGDCHNVAPTGAADMSGRHQIHLGLGFGCKSCHNQTIDGETGDLLPAAHIDGEVTVSMGAGEYDAAARNCTVSCHGVYSWGN